VKQVSGIDETARARELADRYWLDLMEIDPLLGTESGDERVDDRLPDPSEDGRARAEAAHRSALDDLATIDVGALPSSERGTMDLLEALAHRGLLEVGHRLDRLYAASHFSGPVGTLAIVSSLQRTDTRPSGSIVTTHGCGRCPHTSTPGRTWHAKERRPA
jgi:uncharacterized protein (DUF885 family)